ncbi:hypothetical protein HMPREF9446_01131 [Bacteroides fluxus YIT 12057]|uniref:Uncharacterized protein n=1 Tax=Bacteroides fluxus YIT 12057 TaxID=763034 RepID=F3PQY4_9BACE|nr:hypothetical protein HMPREF9446_01131 [Bacteroides fluxus YIT 12057]
MSFYGACKSSVTKVEIIGENGNKKVFYLHSFLLYLYGIEDAGIGGL